MTSTARALFSFGDCDQGSGFLGLLLVLLCFLALDGIDIDVEKWLYPPLACSRVCILNLTRGVGLSELGSLRDDVNIGLLLVESSRPLEHDVERMIALSLLFVLLLGDFLVLGLLGDFGERVDCLWYFRLRWLIKRRDLDAIWQACSIGALHGGLVRICCVAVGESLSIALCLHLRLRLLSCNSKIAVRCPVKGSIATNRFTSILPLLLLQLLEMSLHFIGLLLGNEPGSSDLSHLLFHLMDLLVSLELFPLYLTIFPLQLSGEVLDVCDTVVD